jgi:glycosyltransferase involved in cell wall biosynthesis
VLRVLQVIPTLDRAGAEKQMFLLASALPRERFAVEVAALTRLGPLREALRAERIPVHSIGKRWKVDPLALAKLIRLMRAGRYDVIHTWLFAVVVSEMAVDLWKGRGERLVDQRLASWADRVVGNSEAVVAFYHELGVPLERLMCIPSGIGNEEPPLIDPAEVRAEFGFEPGDPLLLFAGRLAPQKCVSDLLDSIDLLQHILPNLRTLIAGDGPLRERLEARASAFHLLESGRVRFLGHRDDVPRLLAAADLLVLPSRFEGLPNVVLEAMRFRKPVVATRAPGTTAVVVDQETGLLVPVGDRRALAEAIRTVVENPDLARALGEGARRRVERDFDLQVMVDRYAELYESLARGKPGVAASAHRPG